MGVYEHPWLTCELLALHQHLARTEAALLLTGDWLIHPAGIVSHVFDCCSDCIGGYQRQCGHVRMGVLYLWFLGLLKTVRPKKAACQYIHKV